VRDLLAGVAEEYDVVVSTGGTSVGHKDHVIRALDELGEVLFHKVRIRPGKPIGVAKLPGYEAVAFAIPGKPVGAHTIAAFTMGPFFTGEVGPYPTVPATLTVDVGLGPEGFDYVIPVTLREGRAEPLGHDSSPLSVYGDTFDPSVLSSTTRTTRADGVVITTEDLEEGETVEVIPYGVLA
jgi:molybdopterin molybdotransferase